MLRVQIAATDVGIEYLPGQVILEPEQAALGTTVAEGLPLVLFQAFQRCFSPELILGFTHNFATNKRIFYI